MNSFDLTKAVKSEALKLGFELVGVCDAVEAPHLVENQKWLDAGFGASMDYLTRQVELKRHPSSLLPGVKSIVAVGLNYNQTPPTSPKIARYALGRDYHRVLRRKLKKLADLLTESSGEGCRACVDSAPIFERDYANLAGLGWFGKNTLLINSERGSWFFLGLLLTTAKLVADTPALGGCGTCHKCVDACPTGAIVRLDGRWQVDSRSCISYLTIEHRGEFTSEQQSMIGDWTFGCDVCQEVCPFNTTRENQPLRASATREDDFARRSFPSLVELAQISEAEWDALTQGSALRRTGHEGLRRNAQANLASRSAETDANKDA